MGEITQHETTIPKARVQLTATLAPFMQQKKVAALDATDDALVKLLRLNAIVNDRLQIEDVKACNDVPKGQLDPSIELSDKAFGAMSDATKAMLVAAHEAEQSHAVAPSSPLTPQDFAEWRVAMVQIGATDETFSRLTDPIQKAATSPAEKCQIRGLMYRAALQLPKPLTAKIVRSVLSTAASPIS